LPQKQRRDAASVSSGVINNVIAHYHHLTIIPALTNEKEQNQYFAKKNE